jgi:basic membrane protein A
VYDTIKRFTSGEKVSGISVYDLKSGGIDYSTSGGFVDDIKTKLDDLKQQIIDGTITVPDKP